MNLSNYFLINGYQLHVLIPVYFQQNVWENMVVSNFPLLVHWKLHYNRKICIYSFVTHFVKTLLQFYYSTASRVVGDSPMVEYGKLLEIIHFWALRTHRQVLNFTKSMVLGNLSLTSHIPIACLGLVIHPHCWRPLMASQVAHGGVRSLQQEHLHLVQDHWCLKQIQCQRSTIGFGKM